MVLALLIGVSATCSVGEPPLLGRVERVADGDTLTVRADDDRVRVRLFEIDAPEHDQPGSSEARAALARKVDGKFVRVQVEAIDDYRRVVGKVWLGERDINRELVREGHAWVYRHYLEDRSLLDDEAAAREAGRGLWGLPDPVAPWDWRHNGRRSASTGNAAERGSGDGGCVIKGNINGRGDRIYHRPGDESYEQTRIDTSRGERWFCSAAQAEQAGWRAARR